jgi:GNAT superfamily N-acetyltransferase
MLPDFHLASFRLATARDLSAVDLLFARSYPKLLAADYPPSLMVMAVPRLSRAQPGLLASGRYHLAVAEEGRVLAAGGWSGRGAVGELRHLATDPDHLRQGLGSAIVARVLAQARGQGVTAMTCLATLTAVPFYKAQGFQALGRVEISLGPGIGFPVMRMQRQV